MSAGMDVSQRQAADAVVRVLAGATLAAALEASGAERSPARSYVHELAYGTLRHWGTLEAIVLTLAHRRPPDPQLVAILAVALYQLEHMRAEPHAVVDRAVAAAGDAVRPQAKGLANALLRRYLRERDEVLARATSTPVARWSHPRWWIARVRRDWPDDFDRILRAGNERAPLTLRANLRVTTRDALVARLRATGFACDPVGECGVMLAIARPVRELPGFDEGAFSVQDAGAQLAAPLALGRDGERVLDACAAPGGKATHLLERADVDLVALDSDESRLARVRENLARLRLADRRVRVVAGDAASPAAWWDGVPFDRIVADVPCTASGIVRRHPDVKWLRRASDVAAFARVQAAMLDALWGCLARGGTLLYATCSVFVEENEAQAGAFAARTPDALRERCEFPADAHARGGQLLPSLPGAPHNQDGFFYARFRKA
ncbi:MAG TPA: 16S rRNA (cytosine(967)-C(5))-methyltransferase RsmB [Casimicrobiaceae bacterium]|nr:16S rRNA (cytosine(967)-C(5))-methyltransferase RsmB [Casimicrobiaceae bacterium]